MLYRLAPNLSFLNLPSLHVRKRAWCTCLWLCVENPNGASASARGRRLELILRRNPSSEAVRRWAPCYLLGLQHRDQKTAAPPHGITNGVTVATLLYQELSWESQCLGVLESSSCSSLVTCIEGKEGEITVTIPVSLQEIAALAVCNQP